MRLHFLLAIVATLALQTHATTAPTRKCRTVYQLVKAQQPRTAEFLAVLRALGRLVPERQTNADVYVPANWLVLKDLHRRGMSLLQSRPLGSLWTANQKRSLAATVRDSLIVPAPSDRCGKLIHVYSNAMLALVLQGNASQATMRHLASSQELPGDASQPVGRALLQSSSGSWGPIYTNAATNNSGAVGTGYSIFLAGNNAWASGPSGVDPGLLYTSIFSTNNGFTWTNQTNSQKCTQTVNALYSASSTVSATSSSLGASGTYDGVTGSANVGFQSNVQSQTRNAAAATAYTCITSQDYFTLMPSYTTSSDSSVLDAYFYSETVPVIQALVDNQYNTNNPAVLAQLNPWLSYFGTHWLQTSYSGGSMNQVCSMTGYGYMYATSNEFSWGASLSAGVGSISSSSDSSTGTTDQFDSIDAHCTTSQAPASVQVPFSGGSTNTQLWLDNIVAAGALVPIIYTLEPITNIFSYPALFNNNFDASTLSNVSSAIQDYILACASGVTNLDTCPVPSPTCAAQTFASDGSCLSCYTAGPFCPTVGNPSQGAISSCTATTCNCNQPWTGNTCQQYNLGTCFAHFSGGESCSVYSNCCAWGFYPVWNYFQPKDRCGCQCRPSGAPNGYSGSGGCYTSQGPYCGTCGSHCTNPPTSPYTCSS